MKTIKHAIKLETILDEKHELGKRFIALPRKEKKQILDQMAKDLLVPVIQNRLDELNENGSHVILKLAEQ